MLSILELHYKRMHYHQQLEYVCERVEMSCSILKNFSLLNPDFMSVMYFPSYFVSVELFHVASFKKCN